MRPQANHVCDASEDDIKRVVNSIQAQGDAPLFALLDRGGLLKLCNPSQILHRRKRSKQPNDIYYVYGKKNSRIWILRQLDGR